MGQSYKGRKIGTCESMYYMRLDEAQELARMGAADDDGIKFSKYLEDNHTMWRFPFPDEDGKDLLSLPKYDRGFDIPVGDIEVGHDTICFHSERASGGYGVNIIIPCPHSQEFRDQGIKTSTGGPGEQWLTIRFQGIRDGQEKTIFACARCGQLQRFSDDDIVKIKARATEYFESYYHPAQRHANPLIAANEKKAYEDVMKIISLIK